MAKGLREMVKLGEIHPDEAIKRVKKDGVTARYFIKWCDGTGRKRYAQAIKRKVEPKEEGDTESGKKPKKGKKSKGKKNKS